MIEWSIEPPPEPLDDFKGDWVVSTPQVAGTFSAVCYNFAVHRIGRVVGRWHALGSLVAPAILRLSARMCPDVPIPRRKRRFHEKSYYSLGRNDNFPIFTDFY